MPVLTSIEAKRGCGYRAPSADGVGIYLMGGSCMRECGVLPYLLKVCLACGGGIKPSRGWTWIRPHEVFTDPASTVESCKARMANVDACSECPMGLGRPALGGLLWVGEGHYPTPQDFLREVDMVGVSRKISAVPHDFVVGETVIYLAHRKAYPVFDCERMDPGVFSAFTPTHVDLVIDDADFIPKRATQLLRTLGDKARLVKVVRDLDAQEELR